MDDMTACGWREVDACCHEPPRDASLVCRTVNDESDGEAVLKHRTRSLQNQRTSKQANMESVQVIDDGWIALIGVIALTALILTSVAVSKENNNQWGGGGNWKKWNSGGSGSSGGGTKK